MRVKIKMGEMEYDGALSIEDVFKNGDYWVAFDRREDISITLKFGPYPSEVAASAAAKSHGIIL